MSAVSPTFQPGTLDASAGNELTTRAKVLIGGVGALTPITLNLLVVDLQTTFASITAVIVIGYLIRVGILFCIGGGMAYFHKDERSALKLFEIGIVAPALITALMNGTTNVKDATLRASAEAPAASASLMDLIMPTAYAQDEEQDVKMFSRPSQSVASQLWQGISGSQNEKVWFVVAGTYKTNEVQKARELVRRIAQNSRNYNPQIYKNDRHLVVVIGANLTLAQAKAVKEKAYEGKLPTDGDIYLHNPWESK